MQNMLLQIQLLLTALAALLPLAPVAARARLASMLDVAGQALRIGEAAGRHADDLAAKLAAIRRDVERMVESGERITPDRLDEAWARVAAASAAFREAARSDGA